MRIDGVFLERYIPPPWEQKFYCLTIFKHIHQDVWLFSVSKSCKKTFEQHTNPFGFYYEFYAITHQIFVEQFIKTFGLGYIDLNYIDWEETNTAVYRANTPEVVIMRLLRETHFANEKKTHFKESPQYSEEFLNMSIWDILDNWPQPKPLATPRETTPLMRDIQGLPPELQEKIYKRSLKNKLKERREMGWKKEQFDMFLHPFFNRFYCKDQDVHTKAWLCNENLICIACLCKNTNTIHSFGNYYQQKERFLNNIHYGEIIAGWITKRFNVERRSHRFPNLVDLWFHTFATVDNPFKLRFFKDWHQSKKVLNEIRRGKRPIKILPFLTDEE